MRRVVRFTSVTPMRASICASRLLTAGVLMASSRAAALRLPQAASVEKKPSSAGWIGETMGDPIVEFRLKMDSLRA
jgi:hypothetical protein